MPVPYFVADSAQVTVLRSLASTAFGKYNLTLPEGVNLEDVYEVAAPGNELAYVSSLGPRKRVGGMFRRFVRADVDITAKGEGATPASNVERVLDEAAQRTSGDFFLESDISLAGLGPWRPFEDFVVGDVANVEIWGRVVQLRVTRIEPKRTEHSDADWSVHVGGQLVSDADARLAENADIYKAVVDDRRDLAGLDAKIQAESSARKSDVSSVREVLTGAGGSDSDLLASLVGMNRQLQATDSDPQPGLIPAYIELNTKLWETQKKVNDALEAGQRANRDLIEVQQAVSEANREALREIEQTNKARDLLVDRLQQQELQSRSQRIRFFSLDEGSNEHWAVTQEDATFGPDSYSLSAKGDWVGSAVGVYTYTKRNSISGTTNSGYINETVTKPLSLTVSAGNRSASIGGSSGIVWYRVDAGRVRTVRLERTNFLPEQNTWTQIDAFNVLNAGRYTLQTRVVWAAVHRGANYDFRVRVDGGTVVSDSSGTDFGPIGPWGNGVRSREADLVQRDLRVGQRVVFEVRTDASGAASRGVQSAVCRASWIEEE